MKLRWKECRYLKGEKEVEGRFHNNGKKLFIMGEGFDPRMLVGVKAILKADEAANILLICYAEKQFAKNPVNMDAKDKNMRLLQELTPKYLKKQQISIWKSQLGETVVCESVRKAITKETVHGDDEIIVDLSAMPRAISFNIIKRLIDINKQLGQAKKINIVYCENSALDDDIKSIIATDTAEYLQGFGAFSAGMEATNDNIKVWFPVLGLNEDKALSIIDKFLAPDEICPILPFPAADIRREENIIRVYGAELFRKYGIEKRNIIYVPENQPLLMYQKLCHTVEFYERALNQGGKDGINYVFSSQGSKAMDAGVLLTLMELSKDYTVAMAIVENEGYNKESTVYSEANNELCCICLNDNEFEW